MDKDSDEFKKLGARARVLAKTYDLGKQAEGAERTGFEASGIFFGDLGYIEHVIHELSHAQLLELEFGPNLSSTIAAELVRLGNPTIHDDNPRLQLEHECLAWSIEWRCINILGLQESIEWEDILAGAEIQGVTPEELEEGKSFIAIEKYAQCVVDHLRAT